MSGVGVNLETICRGLATQIQAAIPAVNAYWFPLDTPRYPAVIVRPASPFITYHETFGSAGLAIINLDIEVYVASVSPESAAMALYSLLSVGTSDSVFDAVEANRTWGSTVGDAWVSEAGEPTRTDTDNSTVLTATLRAQAYERKD